MQRAKIVATWIIAIAFSCAVYYGLFRLLVRAINIEFPPFPQ